MVASSSGADVFPLLVGQLVEDLPMGCVLLLSQSGSPTQLLLDIQLGNPTRLSLLDQKTITQIGFRFIYLTTGIWAGCVLIFAAVSL